MGFLQRRIPGCRRRALSKDEEGGILTLSGGFSFFFSFSFRLNRAVVVAFLPSLLRKNTGRHTLFETPTIWPLLRLRSRRQWPCRRVWN